MGINFENRNWLGEKPWCNIAVKRSDICILKTDEACIRWLVLTSSNPSFLLLFICFIADSILVTDMWCWLLQPPSIQICLISEVTFSINSFISIWLNDTVLYNSLYLQAKLLAILLLSVSPSILFGEILFLPINLCISCQNLLGSFSAKVLAIEFDFNILLFIFACRTA